MNKNRIRGVANQGERARNREALVTKGKRRRSAAWHDHVQGTAGAGGRDLEARQVAANSRRWWRNSGMLLNAVLTLKWFDQLGTPRLS